MTDQATPIPIHTPVRLHDDGIDVFIFDAVGGCLLRRMKDAAGIEERHAQAIVRAVNERDGLLDALRAARAGIEAIFDDMRECGWRETDDRFYSDERMLGMAGAFVQAHEAAERAERVLREATEPPHPGSYVDVRA